jgi:hypothetical protein
MQALAPKTWIADTWLANRGLFLDKPESAPQSACRPLLPALGVMRLCREFVGIRNSSSSVSQFIATQQAQRRSEPIVS